MSSDKREYFRVSDEVLVSYRVVAGKELEQARDRVRRGVADAFAASAQLAAATRQTETLHKRIAVTQPDVAAYLAALDHKVDMLGRLLLAQAREAAGARLSFVDLSASGLALEVDVAEPEGTCLDLRLVLLPEHVGIVSVARVVRVTRSDDGQRDVMALAFDDITENDREALIEHVVSRQHSELRERRRQADRES